MPDLPAYPREAAEREAAAGPNGHRHELAGWWRRVGAYLLDALLLLLPIGVFVALVVTSKPDDDEGERWVTLFALTYLATFMLPFVYFTLMHGGERGQTLGKRVTGIRVVDGRGEPIGYGRAFGRYANTFLFALFVAPIVLDFLWPLWDAKKQSLHDKIAGTVVVRA